jgi:Holin of 3TMs, for gene-transfer release
MADLTGLGSVADLASTVIGKIWPDKTEQEKAQLAAAVQLVQGQLEINKVEAANPSIFVSGWRPAIGWVCGSALAYTYIIYPMLTWAAAIWFPALKPPLLGNDGMLYELLFGMLGLGAMRTVEKIKGVA